MQLGFPLYKLAEHLLRLHTVRVWPPFFDKAIVDALLFLPYCRADSCCSEFHCACWCFPSHKLWSSAKTSFVDHHLVSFFRSPPCIQLWKEKLKPSISIIALLMSGKKPKQWVFRVLHRTQDFMLGTKSTILAVAAYVWFAASVLILSSPSSPSTPMVFLRRWR